MNNLVFVTGGSSKIFEELFGITISNSNTNKIEYFGPSHSFLDLSNLDNIDSWKENILKSDRIILCHGVRRMDIPNVNSNRFLDCSNKEIYDSVTVNLLSTVKICELALNNNPNVRIVVIGSEAGIKGCFDIPYALSKAALQKYVEERRIINFSQQLVCISPTTISDARTTKYRKDQHNVEKGLLDNPKGRGVTSKEVAELIYFLLFVDQGYVSNTTILMNGGKTARM